MVNKTTRILATVGPSSASPGMLRKMFKAGVDVFRINMSHGSHEQHRKVIQVIRALKRGVNCVPAVLMDLQGPKIRVGNIAQPVLLKKGGTVSLVSKSRQTGPSSIPVAYPQLFNSIATGSIILINDGLLKIKVVKKKTGEAICIVLQGGLLQSHKGINLPHTRMNIPSITRKDKKDIQFGIQQEVDYFALSFVRSEKDVSAIRTYLKKRKAEIPVIAKIEKPEAVNRLERILSIADGVMVARGDLGVELSAQKVPEIQKRIIKKANLSGKIVITATQMLESMIKQPTPTRAEVNDVANAVFDGTDAVMLSGETAVGKHALAAVRIMRKIVEETKESDFQYQTKGNLDVRPGYFPHSVAEAAFHAAKDIDHSALAVFTMSGATAIYLSKLRPQAPIIALTPNPKMERRLSVVWGIQTLKIPFRRNFDQIIAEGQKSLLRSKLARKGQTIIIVAGSLPFLGGTNMMKIHRLS